MVTKERKSIGPRPWRKHGIVIAMLLLCTTNSFGGPMPNPWDDLPQFDSISFSERSVGFGRAYILDRATSRIRKVTADVFAKEFAGALGIEATESTTHLITLKTSSSIELTTNNAYCEDGWCAEHTLQLSGTFIKDHVRPNASVSCAEIVGDQLWLGTRDDGGQSESPADGIVVQSLDTGQLIKTLDTEQGLTGNLIRAIRFDPFDKTIWITTHNGINEVDPNFRVRRALFAFQDLDPDTGFPKTGFSSEKWGINPLVTFFKKLRVSDAKKFYDATRSIPDDILQEFAVAWDGGPFDLVFSGKTFAPKELNILVPFYIEYARSTRSYFCALCEFNDQRAIDFLKEVGEGPAAPSRCERECRNKFLALESLSARQKDDPIALLLAQESQALGRIRASRECRSDDYDVVFSSAVLLRRLGDLRGMDLINEYFKASDFNPGDECFYAAIRDYLPSEIQIAPAMALGLQRIDEPALVIDE